MITEHECAFARIYHVAITKPIGWQLVETGTMPSIMYSSLIILLQVMTNMHESRSSKRVTKVSNFGIRRNQPCVPIIRDAYRRDDLPFATILEASLAKHCDLMHGMMCSRVRIRAREQVSIMQEHDLYTLNHALMYPNVATTSDVNVHVVNIVDASRILRQVTCVTFSVPLVVWRYDYDLLSKVSEAN